MPGACCTRGLVCKSAQKGAHEHTGTVGAFRHSLRNGFTAYGALPGDEFVLPPSLTNRWLAWPGWALQTSASLTPATGARTTRFCRTQPPDFALRASPGIATATASRTYVRDDRDTPLQWDGMAGILVLICPTARAEYFSQTGLDRISLICPTGNRRRYTCSLARITMTTLR